MEADDDQGDAWPDQLSDLMADDAVTTTDEPGEHCPMCNIDSSRVVNAATVSNSDEVMERVMLIHSVMYGHRPDVVVYTRMAEEFNSTCYRHMRNSGLECVEWTPSMVRMHMEQHESDNPVRQLGEHIRFLSVTILSLQRQYNVAVAERTGDEKKLLDSMTTAMKTQKDLMDTLRKIQIQDAQAVNLETKWASFQQSQQQSTDHAKVAREIDSVKCTTGPSDRPSAAEVFDM